MMSILLASSAVPTPAYTLLGTLREKTHAANASATLCDPVKQYSGYYTLSTGTVGRSKNYFYWFFESRRTPSTDPVVMWMTGGPGCSSEVALFGENGPCSINKQGTQTITNDYSWNTQANVLYIDQPTGTGFSWGTGYDHNEDTVAADMYDFLQQFYRNHQQYKQNPFYVVGESYAGHYVPAVTHKVWEMNTKLPSGALYINLKGTSVGNGLTNPEIQYGYYPEMAISSNGHAPAVSNATYEIMKAAVPPCQEAIRGCDKGIPETCILATDVCNLGLIEPYSLTGLNPYDMREKCEVPPLCYDFSNVGVYLSRPDVQQALGVDGEHKWKDCNHAVAIEFELEGDWMHSFQDKLPDQLAAGIRVLMYAGDQDFICNWLGNQAWTRALEWAHKDEFNAAPVTLWNVSGTPAGTLQTAANFSFLRVYDAGHMGALRTALSNATGHCQTLGPQPILAFAHPLPAFAQTLPATATRPGETALSVLLVTPLPPPAPALSPPLCTLAAHSASRPACACAGDDQCVPRRKALNEGSFGLFWRGLGARGRAQRLDCVSCGV